jgi:hypothetical protein
LNVTGGRVASGYGLGQVVLEPGRRFWFVPLFVMTLTLPDIVGPVSAGSDAVRDIPFAHRLEANGLIHPSGVKRFPTRPCRWRWRAHGCAIQANFLAAAGFYVGVARFLEPGGACQGCVLAGQARGPLPFRRPSRC